MDHGANGCLNHAWQKNNTHLNLTPPYTRLDLDYWGCKSFQVRVKSPVHTTSFTHFLIYLKVRIIKQRILLYDINFSDYFFFSDYDDM